MKKRDEYVVLVKEGGGYRRTSDSRVTGRLASISDFLIDEIWGEYDRWLRDILDPKFTGLHFELYGIYRDGDRWIIGSDSFDEPSRYDFLTTSLELIKIISDWRDIRFDPRYNVIIMIRDGDKILFEGRRERCPAKKIYGNGGSASPIRPLGWPESKPIVRVPHPWDSMRHYDEFSVLVKRKGSYVSTMDGVGSGHISGLEGFLSDEIGMAGDEWIKDLSSTGFWHKCGGSYGVLLDDQKVVVGYQPFEYKNISSSYNFITTVSNLKKIIRDWLKVACDLRNNVIIMGMIGDKVSFEGRIEKHPFKKFLKMEPVTEL